MDSAETALVSVEEDQDIAHQYVARKTTCLACGREFQSFDPRYNRRCRSCQGRIENSSVYRLGDTYY